jgi:ribose 5-phosphate isomerase B
VIDELGVHCGKEIVFGYDRHLAPELAEYQRVLAGYGPVVSAVADGHLHYLTSAERVCRRLQAVSGGVGVLVCRTGMGMSIAANKFEGIYAVRCLSVQDACDARTVNNANVLCLALTTTLALNQAIIDAFMITPYRGRKLDELVYLLQLEANCRGQGRARSTSRSNGRFQRVIQASSRLVG